MKILKSKFFKPIKYLVSDYKNGIDSILLEETTHQPFLVSSTPYTDLLDRLLSNCFSSYFEKQLVIKEEKLKFLEKCDDFVCYTYSKELGKILENELCYFHNELEIFVVLTQNLSNDYDKEIFEEGIFKVSGLYYDNTNSKNQANVLEFFEKFLEKYIAPNSKISLLVKEGNNIELNEYSIKSQKIDFKTMYNDDFLPISEHIVKKLKEDNKGIVLLHGLPGTGKTNYIKWLTGEIFEKKFIFVPTSMISSLIDPHFINFLIENKNSVLIFEDCENYISERSSTNVYTDVVASILNLADGILSDVVECQIICTFNANIDKIDGALLRQGRLIAEYCFKELSLEKMEKYFKSVNIDYKTEKTMTLAEVINIEQKIFREKETEITRIGFNVD